MNPSFTMVGGTGTGLIGAVQQPDIVESGDGEPLIEPSETFASVLSVAFWDREFYRTN